MIDQVLNMLIQSSWQILILALIVWPLSRLSKRAYPNFAYILWVVILIKALIPITITLPAPQIPIVEMAPVFTGQFIQANSIESSGNLSVKTILAIMWLTGVVLLTMKLFVSESTHRKKIRHAVPISSEPWFEDMQAELGIRQKITLYVNEHIQSPLMQGLWKVKIYLPLEFNSWTLEEQQSVLAHELTHVRRLDIVTIYLQAAVRTLYFFHPIIWLVNDQIDLEREKICDDAAIELSRTERKVYGDQLFRQLATEPGTKSVPVLAGGFFMSDSSIIKRFRYINEKRGNMRNKLKLYHVILILSVISIAFVIACTSEVESNLVDPGKLSKTTQDSGFVAYDKPPRPAGGYAEIQKNVVYPELARKAGIGGTTIIQVIVDTQGKAGGAEILRSAGDESLDSAAVRAVLKTVWIPAQLKDSPVSVRIAIPVVFKLKNGDSDSSVSSTKPAGQIDWNKSPRPVSWKTISQNVVYPETARRDGITGTLTMQFTIDEKGNLIDPVVKNGPKHEALKKAAIFALRSTKWTPAEQDGNPVSATMEMGISFGSADKQNQTQKIANGLRPLDRLGNVPVTIKGPDAEEKASDISFKIYINSDGLFESISGSISYSDEDVIVDKKALDRWMKSKWEAVPKEDRLEGQWIEVPLEFTFVD
ncbi:MAG: M56 family metallopeptidase [Candidatus Marinimicrobia bacterium]|nr:M56 family metallopeptidase [Candidatus Neomarinimicrobiota bacterium]